MITELRIQDNTQLNCKNTCINEVNKNSTIGGKIKKALKITAVALACLAAAAGIVTLTIFFPHVMVPIGVFTGVVFGIPAFILCAYLCNKSPEMYPQDRRPFLY